MPPRTPHPLDVWRIEILSQNEDEVRHRDARGSDETWTRHRPALGKGAYGTVWKEQCIAGQKTGQLRAVKAILKKHDKSWLRELTALSKVSEHTEHFVQLHGWFVGLEHLYIAMEFVEHGCISEHIMYTALPEKETIVIVKQLAQALQFMHRVDYLHRDLKPQNILVARPGPQWHVKLADFGIAKDINSDGISGGEQGTEGFKAPEILLRGGEKHQYTKACDVWSLGIMAFLLLTKAKPFRGGYEETVGYVNGNVAFPTKPDINRKCTFYGVEFIKGALRPNAADRPSIDELLACPWLQPDMDSPTESDNDDLWAPGSNLWENTLDKPVKHDSGIAGTTANLLDEAAASAFKPPAHKDRDDEPQSRPAGPGLGFTAPLIAVLDASALPTNALDSSHQPQQRQEPIGAPLWTQQQDLPPYPLTRAERTYYQHNERHLEIPSALNPRLQEQRSDFLPGSPAAATAQDSPANFAGWSPREPAPSAQISDHQIPRIEVVDVETSQFPSTQTDDTVSAVSETVDQRFANDLSILYGLRVNGTDGIIYNREGRPLGRITAGVALDYPIGDNGQVFDQRGMQIAQVELLPPSESNAQHTPPHGLGIGSVGPNQNRLPERPSRPDQTQLSHRRSWADFRAQVSSSTPRYAPPVIQNNDNARYQESFQGLAFAHKSPLPELQTLTSRGTESRVAQREAPTSLPASSWICSHCQANSFPDEESLRQHCTPQRWSRCKGLEDPNLRPQASTPVEQARYQVPATPQMLHVDALSHMPGAFPSEPEDGSTRLWRFACSECVFSSDDRATFKEHLSKTGHWVPAPTDTDHVVLPEDGLKQPQKPLKCTECNRLMKDAAALEAHFRLSHGKQFSPLHRTQSDSLFVCSDCPGRVFPDEASQESHLLLFSHGRYKNMLQRTKTTSDQGKKPMTQNIPQPDTTAPRRNKSTFISRMNGIPEKTGLAPAPPPRTSNTNFSSNNPYQQLRPMQSTTNLAGSICPDYVPPVANEQWSARLRPVRSTMNFTQQQSQQPQAPPMPPRPSRLRNMQSTVGLSDQPPAQPTRDIPLLQKLVDMGFERDRAVEALEIYSYDIRKALDSLVEHRDKI